MTGDPIVAVGAFAPPLTTATTVAAPTPSPSPPLGELDPNDVSPGLLGFVVIFAVVLLCIPLLRSMTSKIRGVEHRPEPTDEPGGTDPAAGRTPRTP